MAANQVSEYPCPKCGKPRVTRISHTERNPNRAFLTCPAGCDGSFQWVDSLPKYATQRPLDLRTPSQRTVDFLAKVEEAHPREKVVDAIPATPIPSTGGVLDFLNITAPTVVTQPDFVPSKYQEDIFSFVKGDNGNAVIEAVAGSGKTSTLVKALDLTPSSSKVAFLCFNKHIAEELRERAPEHTHVSTLHSLGFMNARNAMGDKLKVNEHKLWDLWDELDPYNDLYALKPNAIKIVNLLKATLREPTKDNLDYLVDRYSVEMDGDLDKFYDLTPQLYAKSVKEKNELDFSDMVFWSATGEIECHKFDIVFSDESQDYNSAQRQMILNSVRAGGRVIAVGDRKQAIMGFQGSDTESIPKFIKELNATVLPLSICYRCHKGAVRLAQKLVPQIEWREGAIEGITQDVTALKQMKEGDMVLCRINAPLVEPCFALIREGVKATIRGRDIGNGLVAMLLRGEKRAMSKEVQAVFRYLDNYVRQECHKLIQQRREARAAGLQDQLDTLYALSEDCRSTGEIKTKINQVFSDEKSSVTFSSQHRSKGLESNRVFILKPELNPFPRATQAWEMEQELNLLYVAVTRPKQELYFIGERPILLQ